MRVLLWCRRHGGLAVCREQQKRKGSGLCGRNSRQILAGGDRTKTFFLTSLPPHPTFFGSFFKDSEIQR